MERDSWAAVERPERCSRPVFPIAQDWQTARRELNAELVAPAGGRPQFEQGGPGVVPEHLEGESCLLPALRPARDDPHDVSSLVLPECVGPLARVLRATPLDPRPVYLLDRPRPELLRES